MLKKHIISLFLVCLMALSLGTAFASEITIDSAALSESVADLNKLGVMVGDDKGDFRGEANITRAEFSTIICRILGMEEMAKTYPGNSFFTDTAGHWAENYINLACEMNIINGFGNGLFCPDEKITLAQTAKMLVCALGYERMGMQYPGSYTSKANQLQIFKSLDFAGQHYDSFSSTICTRNHIAVMIHNALDAPLCKRTTFTMEDQDNPRNFTIYNGENGNEFKSLRTETYGIYTQSIPVADTSSDSSGYDSSVVEGIFVTPTGKRYHHLASCAGKNAIETTLEEALAQGKTPCQTCAK